MFNKQQFFESIAHENHILKHLASKLEVSKLDYRPTEKQRSILETLQYLSFVGIASATGMVNGNWDHYPGMAETASEVNLDNFAAKLDEQFESLKTLLSGLSDDDLLNKTAPTPWGTELPLGHALVDMTTKCYTAYRMQLFLFMKQNGYESLGTHNCWGGADAPAQEAS